VMGDPEDVALLGGGRQTPRMFKSIALLGGDGRPRGFALLGGGRETPRVCPIPSWAERLLPHGWRREWLLPHGGAAHADCRLMAGVGVGLLP